MIALLILKYLVGHGQLLLALSLLELHAKNDIGGLVKGQSLLFESALGKPLLGLILAVVPLAHDLLAQVFSLGQLPLLGDLLLGLTILFHIFKFEIINIINPI